MKKPKIEYYWTPIKEGVWLYGYAVNWRLVGANGEIMCQSTQGFRDKADAQESVMRVTKVLTGFPALQVWCKEVGPGRKPK